MHRPAQRLTRILACAAAVPVILVAAGCSSDSGSGDDEGAKPSSTAGATASKAPAAAAYAKLPDPCTSLTSKTRDALVPEADAKSGKAGQSDDTSLRANCSWSSLDNNGVKGSQFRWLNVSLLRFASDASRGSGDKQAGDYVGKQVAAAKATEGATGVQTEPVAATGDEATLVRYDLKKKEGSFKQQTVVARVKNVVVTVDYDGAGLAGEKTPNADDLVKDAEQAAKDAVNAVVAANEGGGTGATGGDGSDAPTAKSPSKPPSKSPSPKPSSSKSSSSSGSSSSKSPSDDSSEDSSGSGSALDSPGGGSSLGG